MKCPPKFYNFNIIQQDPDVSGIKLHFYKSDLQRL